MKSTFEKMGGTYTLGADGIYYPNLVSTDEEPHYGKYGMLRKTYLKEHRPAMYSLYMLEDRLTKHLNAVDDEAQERMGILVRQRMEKQGVTEELKARDQMVWVDVYKRQPFHRYVCNLIIGFISYSHYIYRCIFYNEKLCFCNKYSKGATHVVN